MTMRIITWIALVLRSSTVALNVSIGDISVSCGVESSTGFGPIKASFLYQPTDGDPHNVTIYPQGYEFEVRNGSYCRETIETAFSTVNWNNTLLTLVVDHTNVSIGQVGPCGQERVDSGTILFDLIIREGVTLDEGDRMVRVHCNYRSAKVILESSCRAEVVPAAKVTSIYPNFGPVSGSTILEIKIDHMSPLDDQQIETIKVAGVTCNITRISSIVNTTTFECLTGISPSIRNGTIAILQYGNTTLSNATPGVDFRYSYLPDPEIKDITNTATPVSGGIDTNVIGVFLTSVADPQLLIAVRIGNTSILVQQKCNEVSFASMACQVPNLNHAVSNITSKIPVLENLNITELLDSFDFEVGVLLDGVKKYENLTKALPNNPKTKLQVTPDIELKELEDFFYANNWLKILSLSIPVETPSQAVKGSDMNVRVGDSSCEVVQLNENALLCRLPERKPDYGTFGPGQDLSYFVQAQVGEIGRNYSVGYVKYVNMELYTGLGGGGLVILIIGLVILGIYCKRRKKAVKTKQIPEFVDLKVLTYDGKYEISRVEIAHLDKNLSVILGNKLLEYKTIKMKEILGQGHSGIVYKAILNKKDVAVKTIKASDCTEDQLSEFLTEALAMKNFDHPNVLSLVGVAMNDTIPFAVIPFMTNGDLKSYIENPRRRFTFKDMLEICKQVAQGMEYLESRRFVHRDLAARNCMVSYSKEIKIGDFGLSRDIYSDTYYMDETLSRPLPIRWMAPESLLYGKYSSMSDVWSFGVLMWEVHTRGGTPYADLESREIKSYVINGRRLEKPPLTHDDVYAIMWYCWENDSHFRPTFKDLVEMIGAILNEAALQPFAKAQTTPGSSISLQQSTQSANKANKGTKSSG